MKRGRERRAFSGAGYIFWGKPLCPPPMLESLPKTSFLGFEVFIGSLEGRTGCAFSRQGDEGWEPPAALQSAAAAELLAMT